MPVIDVQVHPFDRNHPGRPWASPSHGLDSATGEEMVAAMNSVGVDGATDNAVEPVRCRPANVATGPLQPTLNMWLTCPWRRGADRLRVYARSICRSRNQLV